MNARIGIKVGSALLALALGTGRASAEVSATREPAPGNTEPQPAAEVREQPAESAQPTPPSDRARGYEQEPGTEPEDVALAVPRVVLAVPRYTLKLAFFPVQQSVLFLDRHAVIEEVQDVLYNDARTAAIVPKLAIDGHFGPSIGVKAFHSDLAGHGEYASVAAQLGGVYDWASQLSFRADRFGGTPLWLESSVRFESDPSLLFQGIGTRDADQTADGPNLDARAAAVATRFQQERLLGMLRAGYTLGQPGRQLQIGATALYNVRDFGAKDKGAEPSTEQVYDTKSIVGFDRRVATLEADLNLVVDTRDVKGATSSGQYFDAFAGRVPQLGSYGFWHYGAEATAYIDLSRRTRVLVLRAVFEGVEGDADEIPFSELPRLGGANRLRGYPLDRFRDEKAAVGTVEYRYPIHQYVAGSVYVDTGKVAKSYGDFLDSNWKVGAGGGFVVRSRESQLFAFDVAYGEGVQFYVTTEPLRAFAKRDTEL